MRMTFLGATGTVTGSKYLIEVGNTRIFVDCGLFQGYKELRSRNWSQLPVEPASIHAVILTHAHIDHSGYLPLLIKNGFKGKIYCSVATRDLCAILLPDSGYLQEEEARLANFLGYSKHKPALPLYTQEDAELSLAQFVAVDFGKEYKLPDELSFKLTRAGHILGASFVELRHEKMSLLFSGDLGRPHDPIMKPPAIMQFADYLVLESTYGDSEHGSSDPLHQMAKIVNETVQGGGSVLIPAFAVGRAQSMLYYLYELKKRNLIPDVPIYLDSPMAVNATKIFCEQNSEHRLSREHAIEICKVAHYIGDVIESQALDENKSPMIIISASGMATGGRVLSHLQNFLPDARNTILFTGFQAGGTLGDRLTRGETEIKIRGQKISVHAKIETLANVSAHADANEIMEWLQKFTRPPRKVFITHGEPAAALALQTRIISELHWDCEIPQFAETVLL